MTANWAGCLGIAALAGALALGGCVPAPPPPPPPVVAATEPDGPPLPPPPLPARKPVPHIAPTIPGVAMIEPDALPEQAPSPEPLPPPAPTGDASQVQGMDEAAALALLGQPQLRTEMPPANLWRYDNGTCTLELYFYLDLETGEMRVLHYQITEHDGAQQSDQQCYGQLVGSRERPAQSVGAADPPR